MSDHTGVDDMNELLPTRAAGEVQRTPHGEHAASPSRPPLAGLAWLRDKLTGRRVHAAIIAFTLLLSLPALWVSVDSDDYFQIASLRETRIEGVVRAPWDLYAFAKDRASNLALRDQGVWPWWVDEDVVVAFFRPLTSLTRWLDHTLWPDHVWLMQLQSLAWFAALLVVVSRIYRRFLPVPWVAALALLLFASDEGRAATISWLCNRNALVALVFGFATLLAHDRWRAEGKRAFGVLAAVLFAVGLLGGETALQVGGYLVAYALVRDRGKLAARALSLAPYGIVFVLYAALYKTLGYGASGSDVYVDPVSEPLLFLRFLPERLVINTQAMFHGVSADWFNVLPLLGEDTRPLMALAVVLAGAVLFAFGPLVLRDPLARFFAIGAVLATLPVCGVTPSDRMLTGAGLGAMALLALFFASLVEGRYPSPRRWLVGYAWLLVFANLVLAPLLRPYFITMTDDPDDLIGRADRSLPEGPDVGAQTWVVLNPPFDTFGVFAMMYRDARKLPLPAHFRWLATGVSSIRVERVADDALKVAPSAGFLSTSSQLMLRSLEKPLRVGDRTALSGVTFEILSLTEDGRPAEVLVRFERSLDDPQLKLLRWGEHEYVPLALPPVGEALEVPAVDMTSALQG